MYPPNPWAEISAESKYLLYLKEITFYVEEKLGYQTECSQPSCVVLFFYLQFWT